VSDNVEIVRALYPPDGLDWAAIMGQRSTEDAYLDRVRPLLHPDFEVAWVDQVPGEQPSGTIVGMEAYIEALRQMTRGFEKFRIVPERFVDLGDRVVVVARLHARGRSEGAEVVGEGGAILTMADGQIRLLQEFPSREELFDAAGISAAEADERGVEAGI
jgi:ketosteroid isomerase-like protein